MTDNIFPPNCIEELEDNNYTEEEVDILFCHECQREFEIETDSEPTECPLCGISFDSEGE